MELFFLNPPKRTLPLLASPTKLVPCFLIGLFFDPEDGRDMFSQKGRYISTQRYRSILHASVLVKCVVRVF
jgi:hypothetical protein